MNDVTRPPGRDLLWSAFDEPLDNLFEGFFRPARRGATQQAMAPAVDIVERDKDYVVKADLPGIKKENINVTLQDGLLTISAASKEEKEQKEGERVIRRERRYGHFTRTLQLGQEIDESKVVAGFKDGVLELTLPKKAAAQPKKITVDIS